MRIIKYGHACVRLELDEGVIVIDPGEWSEAEALTGADAVLVTHEHSDHVDAEILADAGIQVYAPAGANIDGLAFIGLRSGELLTAGGAGIRAVGSRHAASYGQGPDCQNLGYIVNESLYHPGDALCHPEQPIETLFLPMQASWLKTSEAIDFAKHINPDRVIGMHDAQLNDRGIRSVNHWLGQTLEAYRWVPAGTSV